MNFNLEISSWEGIELSHLFYAFRKAKADCFFERSICIAQNFAEYEQTLPAKLSSLLQRLHEGEALGALSENIGEPKIMAKKLGVSKKRNEDSGGNGHGFFSSPDRAFRRLSETNNLIPEFRIVGDFPVEMHVLSALWINHVGHKYDAKLGSSAYGSRLRRYRRTSDQGPNAVGKYQLDAIGSFQPYFRPYKEWREGGMKAIRHELEADRKIIAVSMDLTSYYHRIDPSFLVNPTFLAEIDLQLNEWEMDFTNCFVQALKLWSSRAASLLREMDCEESVGQGGGIPIGISIVRIISNVLLAGLDRDILQGLTPVFYGRYVDDMFLVLRDPGNLLSMKDLIRFIGERTKYFPKKAESEEKLNLRLPSGYRGKTSLILQQSKQKSFFLEGRGGLDLLDNIESEIQRVSSERRLMTNPDRLERMVSAQVLTSAGQSTDEVDTFRRADGLSVRRLGWSIQLRSVETLAKDLRPKDWRDEREKFYKFSHNHILRPDRILDHIDYLPRLLSFAVALRDWSDARIMVELAVSAIRSLRECVESQTQKELKVNGYTAKAKFSTAWDGLEKALFAMCADAIARSLPWSGRRGGIHDLSEVALSLCARVRLPDNQNQIEELSQKLRESDWSKTAYKDHLRRDAKRQRPAIVGEALLHPIYRHVSDLVDFLKLTAKGNKGTNVSRISKHYFRAKVREAKPSLLPYLFPTRPYTAGEISLFLPETCVFNKEPNQAPREWARFVRGVRGVWVWGTLVANGEVPKSSGFSPEVEVAFIGKPSGERSIRLGISSLLTLDKSFDEGASGTPDISRTRYSRIETIVNQAIEADPRPTHLLLPELALPERWLDTVAGRLRDAGISLIAGLDYRVRKSSIHSEAVLVLTDDRLGYPSTVQIRQPKSQPSPGEEESLLSRFGLTWTQNLESLKKPVYVHNGFCFGVLVCSELQNIAHRSRFQGNVDCLMILSWNKDLDTFSALVEASSLDVHSYIALVNNRSYGDSRVRVPAKQPYARDLCRLKGGRNEQIAVVQLDIDDLRAFQSKARRWPKDDDKFKPVPEGFQPAIARTRMPS